MFTRANFLVIAFSLLTQISFAQFDLTKNLPTDPDVKIGKLANGLTYYIKKNIKPEKKVQLRLVVNTGSVMERPDQQGLAHMMEHMNFNGSTHFQKNELVNYLQSIGVKFGADLNASTGFDETIYILPIPSDDPEKVDKGFTILEDWAGNATLSTEEINKERGVVLEESRLGKGAMERMGKQYFPLLFNGSQYSMRLPIGKDSILQNFDPEVLRQFYKTWYRPDLMAVIVVGDIDPALAEQEIIKHFAQFKNPTNEQPRPAIIQIAERKKDQSIVLTDKEQTLNILQVFNYVEKAKPINTWAAYRQTIVENLFNTIINQRLNELTQQPNPPFLFGGTSFQNFIRGYRAFISVAAVSDKPINDAVNAMAGVTESVKKYGFLAAELDRAKSGLLTQTENAFKDKDKTESARMVQEYISNYLSGLPIIGISNRYNFIKQTLPTITLQEVNALAKKMETTQGKFAMLLAPEKNKENLPTDNDLLALVTKAHNMPAKPYTEKAIATSLMTKLPTPGKITATTTNQLLGTTDLTLSNGITITLKPTEFKNDQIQMDAWRRGGSHGFAIADKENAENAASIIDAMGVSDLSPTDLRKFLTGKTINVTPYINSYDEGIDGTSTVKDFETFLQLVNLYFTHPRKDALLFQSFINNQKGFVQNMKSNPNTFFADTVVKIQYNNNPWADGIPSASDFDKINLDKSFKIYNDIFGNAYGMHFTFVGNIDPKTAQPLLERYLGSLSSSKKENVSVDEGLRPMKGIINATINKGAAKQSQVNILFSGPATYSKAENLKLRALMDVLNIRMIEKLREEMSGIYGGGMNGSITNRPYNHYGITISFPCGPENVDKLTTALFELIKNVQNKGIEESYLSKVKETLKKTDQDRVKQNEYWLAALSQAWIENDDPALILNYPQRIDALTTADLQQTAQKYFNMQNYIKSVLNPEK